MKYEVDVTIAEGPKTGVCLGDSWVIDTCDLDWQSVLHKPVPSNPECNELVYGLVVAILEHEETDDAVAAKDAKRESLMDQLCLDEVALRALYEDLRSVMEG